MNAKESHREYHRNYQRNRHARRRAQAVELLGGACRTCGSCNDLQFDHIDPTTKEFSIGEMFSKYSEAALNRELEKCQLLCFDCHKTKSASEAGERAPWNKGSRRDHGSYYGVYTLKCKCNACSEYREQRLAKRRVSPRFPKPLKG